MKNSNPFLLGFSPLRGLGRLLPLLLFAPGSQAFAQKIVQTRMQYDFDKKEAVAQAEQEKKDALTNQELQRQN